jgi:hypothetical protein
MRVMLAPNLAPSKWVGDDTPVKASLAELGR